MAAFLQLAIVVDAIGGDSIQPRQLLVVAHRGLLREAPENTPAAFQSCLALRMGFELDVRRSSDGKLVCLHDDTLDRTTDGDGAVAEKTWADLQKLDAGGWFGEEYRGERMPAVEEVFAMIAKASGESILIAVDVKIADENIERDLVQLATDHGVLDRLAFIGRTIESARMRERFKKAEKRAQTARLVGGPSELAEALREGAADWIYVRFPPSAADVQRIHNAAKRVILVGPLVAGSEPENWRAGAAAGVDAILTDYPLELRRQIRGDAESSAQ